MSNVSVYQLWCLASLFKTKTVSRIHNYLLGHVNEVDRIDNGDDVGYVQFVCDHIQNLLKHPNHIIDHIYLGSGIHAMNRETLDQFEIEGILNATQELPQYFEEDDFLYLQLPVRDTRDAFLMNHYENIRCTTSYGKKDSSESSEKLGKKCRRRSDHKNVFLLCSI